MADVSETLAKSLRHWEHWELASYRLGRAVGLFQGQGFVDLEVELMLRADNIPGSGLYDALVALVRAEVLEQRFEPEEQFRWHAAMWPQNTTVEGSTSES